MKFLSLILCATLVSASAQVKVPKPDPQAAGFSAEGLNKVDAIAEKLVEEKKLAGCVIAISRNNELAYFKSFGHQEVDGKREMKPDAVFRIYSMTKGIVSTAALMMVEEGKLDLDQPVSTYIPEWKNLQVYDASGNRPPKREMIVRDLFRHTAGLTYGLFGNTPVDKLYRQNGMLNGSLNDMIKKLGEVPLLYDPGENWVYSVASDVLGYLVEKQSGEKLDVFMTKRIFVPLGMKDSGFQVRPDQKDRFVTCYGPDEAGGLKVHEAVEGSRFLNPPRMLSGGGGMISTTSDYLAFCQMIANGGELHGQRLLKKETVDLMRTNQLKKEIMPISIGLPRAGTGFGLGFSVRVAESPRFDPGSQVGEYGWGGAASTHYWMSPKDNVVVVTMEQTMPYTSTLETAIKKAVYEAVIR